MARTFRLFLWTALPVMLWMFPVPGLRAQGCAGTLLYRENFGGEASSADLGPPLAPSVTGYAFTSGEVKDGYYSIRKRVPGDYSSWLSGSDHTGGGYMMVVNASYTAGLFYETRIPGLCQGSSFYFSAWVANLLKASSSDRLDPDLRFVIRRASDSSVIKSLETGYLPRYATLNWKEYGIHFDLPAGESSVILQIFNHQTGGSGNDLALDDISFSLCGPVITLDEVGAYEHSFDVCEGIPVRIEAAVESGFYQHPAFRWQYGADTLHWTDLPGQDGLAVDIASSASRDSGWYRLVAAEADNLASPYCRSASAPIPLNVFAPLQPVVTSNSPVCEGDTLRLEATAGLSYEWTGPGGFTDASQRPVIPGVGPAASGTYGVTLVSRGGCVSQAGGEVMVQAEDLHVALGSDSVFCEGTTVTLQASNPGATYQWSTGAETPFIEVDTGGDYWVTVSRGVCSMSDSLSLREVERPVADLGSDTTICYGEPFALDATFADAGSYLWQDGSMQPQLAVRTAGTYSVSVANSCGVAFSSIVVKTEECADHLIFPTAFTPNGDGQNDLFRPRVVIRVSDYHLHMMDRWGHTVFETADVSAGWDGRMQGTRLPVGTYVWVAAYLREKDGKHMIQKGFVTLLR